MKQWVRIRSIHLAARILDDGRIGTQCGKAAPADADTYDVRPAGKTCESCYRRYVGR